MKKLQHLVKDGMYNHEDATGYINIHTLPTKVEAIMKNKNNKNK